MKEEEPLPKASLLWPARKRKGESREGEEREPPFPSASPRGGMVEHLGEYRH